MNQGAPKPPPSARIGRTSRRQAGVSRRRVRAAALAAAVVCLVGLAREGAACDAILGQAYSDPPEVPRFALGSSELDPSPSELDPSGWEVAARLRDLAMARKHWVRPGATLRDWKELLTWKVSFRSRPQALARTRDLLLVELRRKCDSLGSREIASEEDDLLFEWWHDGCYGRPSQHELVRLVQGVIGTHQLSYAQVGERLSASERERWSRRLGAVVLESEIPPSAGAGVDRARTLYWHGRDSEAIELLEPLAERGRADAQEELAGLYFGRWDLERSLHWFRKAAEQNRPEALYHLGRMHENGWGMRAPDRAAAIDWYHAAAERGHAGSRVRLAQLAISEAQPDATAARTWLEPAVASGDVEAMIELARLLERPVAEKSEGAKESGHPRSDDLGGADDLAAWQLERAVSLYRRAAVEGASAAQFALGRSYAEGRGVGQNDAEAVHWLVRAAMQGHEEARAFYVARYREMGSRTTN